MKHLIHLFARLYPAAWRKRYEAEFNALLEDVNPNWRASFDVLKGAVAIQLRTISLVHLLATSGLVGLLARLGLWFAIPNQYASQAILHIAPSPMATRSISRDAVAVQLTQVARITLSDSSLLEVVRKNEPYLAEQPKLPLEDILKKMRRKIVLSPAGPPTEIWSAICVQFVDGNPSIAQRVARDLAVKFMDVAVKNGTPASEPITIMFTYLPSPAGRASSPNFFEFLAAGFTAGLAVGASIGLIRRSLNPA